MNASNHLTLKNAPGNIFLIGFMGSGKSHWGKIWAEANQLLFVDLDEMIENKEGQTIAAIFGTRGEDYFRKIEAAALRLCARSENSIIACGGGTPCFYENMDWMKANGKCVYIECTAQEILERVSSEKDKRPLLKELSHAELLLFIEKKLTERAHFYQQANITIQSASLNKNALPEILSAIKS